MSDETNEKKVVDNATKNVYIRKLILCGYKIMQEHTDFPHHIQLYRSQSKTYIYLDIFNNQFKVWKLDINGHAPVIISSFLARLIADCLDNLHS